MNKGLQRDLLRYIRKCNKRKGVTYPLMADDIHLEFVIERKHSHVEVMNNLRFLKDIGKIEANFLDNKLHPQGSIRVTPLGYNDLEPPIKRLWRFFNKDMAKFLSVIATILSIISITIQISRTGI